MLFVRPALILVFDRLTDELFCIAPVWPSALEADAALDSAGERIDEALRRLALAAPAAVAAADLPEPALDPGHAGGRL